MDFYIKYSIFTSNLREKNAENLSLKNLDGNQVL